MSENRPTAVPIALASSALGCTVETAIRAENYPAHRDGPVIASSKLVKRSKDPAVSPWGQPEYRTAARNHHHHYTWFQSAKLRGSVEVSTRINGQASIGPCSIRSAREVVQHGEGLGLRRRNGKRRKRESRRQNDRYCLNVERKAKFGVVREIGMAASPR